MSTETPTAEKTLGRLFVPSLAIAAVAVSISAPMLMILTADMAITFFGDASQASIGIMAQATTINQAAEVGISLLMGILAIRFRHKSLLLVGVMLVAFSAIGGFLAPNFSWTLLFFTIEGIGTMIFGIIALTLIGDLLPLDKKAKTISYYIAIIYAVFIFAPIAIGIVANIGGWRSIFIVFTLPIAVAGLVMTFFIIPNKPKQSAIRKESYVNSFKQVLLNKSATSCLVASILLGAAFVGVFSIAFFRRELSMPMEIAAIVVSLASAMYVFASLIGGRLVNRFGRKTVTVSAVFLSGVFAVPIFFMPNWPLAVIVDMFHVWFAALAFTASRCLFLEQVQNSRSTMMSLSALTGNIGNVIGPVVGGALLILFSYQAVGLMLGVFAIAAAAVLFFLTKDPTIAKPIFSEHS